MHVQLNQSSVPGFQACPVILGPRSLVHRLDVGSANAITTTACLTRRGLTAESKHLHEANGETPFG